MSIYDRKTEVNNLDKHFILWHSTQMAYLTQCSERHTTFTQGELYFAGFLHQMKEDYLLIPVKILLFNEFSK